MLTGTKFTVANCYSPEERLIETYNGTLYLAQQMASGQLLHMLEFIFFFYYSVTTKTGFAVNAILPNSCSCCHQ